MRMRTCEGMERACENKKTDEMTPHTSAARMRMCHMREPAARVRVMRALRVAAVM